MGLFLQDVNGKENKVPAERFGYEATEVKSLAAQSTKLPARRAFGVTNKVNVKRSILDGQQNYNCLSATRGPAQTNLNQNSVLRSTYTVISSKFNLNAATQVKKQLNTGMRSSAKVSSNVGHTAVIPSNTRFASWPNAAWSVPVKTVSVRMSLGPIVRTKTGLIPAVTQPRNTNSHLLHISATAPDTITTATSVANKVISRPSSSVSVSQRSTVAQRKTISATVENNPVNERTTVSLTARSQKVKDQSKSNLKPLLVKHSQPSCKSQMSSGLKSASLSSKSKAVTIMPERKGMSKTNQSAGQHTDRSTKQRSEGRGEKNDRLYKVTCPTSLGPSTRCSSRAVSGAAVAEMCGKTMKCKEIQSKKGHSSTNVLSQQTGIKRTDVPLMSKTVPQPPRTISFTGKPTEMKTPKVLVRVIPQTEGKKLTAAQEERM